MNLLYNYENNNYEVKIMAVSHKTTIAFSLVSVPVSLYTATQDNDLLHKTKRTEKTSILLFSYYILYIFLLIN